MTAKHVRAVKTFQGRLGLIRAGTIFRPDPGYYAQLKKNGLIVDATEEEMRRAAIEKQPGNPNKPGPGEQREDKSIPGAPHRKDQGKDQPGSVPQNPGSEQASTPAAGEGPKSSASGPGQASPEKTLTSSSIGAKPHRKRAARKQPAKSPPDA